MHENIFDGPWQGEQQKLGQEEFRIWSKFQRSIQRGYKQVGKPEGGAGRISYLELVSKEHSERLEKSWANLKLGQQEFRIWSRFQRSIRRGYKKLGKPDFSFIASLIGLATEKRSLHIQIRRDSKIAIDQINSKVPNPERFFPRGWERISIKFLFNTFVELKSSYIGGRSRVPTLGQCQMLIWLTPGHCQMPISLTPCNSQWLYGD